MLTGTDEKVSVFRVSVTARFCGSDHDVSALSSTIAKVVYVKRLSRGAMMKVEEEY